MEFEVRGMKVGYPVLFTRVNECVLVEVPDLEILTQGKDMVDANTEVMKR